MAAFAQDAQPDASSEQRTGISEIIVTAQRRAEPAQSVPIAITAFSSDRLERQGINSTQNLQAMVPSLTVTSTGQGSRDVQMPAIRGQGASFQASPGVVLYLNDVPLPAPITTSHQGGPGNYVDLENVQVLAGPQGTLFGRNTTGGAILLVPNKPTENLEGWISGRIGNYDARELEGVLNVPVVSDKLMVRVVGAYHDRDGYTRDVVRDIDLDDKHWYSGRLGITFRPSEAVENYLMIYGSRSKNNGTAQIHTGFNIPGLQGVGFCVDPPLTPPGPSFIAVSCDVYRAATQQARDRGPRAAAPGYELGEDLKTWGLSNTTSIDISDNLMIRNIFSYQEYKNVYYFDGDGTYLQQYDPNPRSNDLPRDSIKNITEELQLQGNFLDGDLRTTLGVFYYDQKPNGAQGTDSIVYCPAAFTGFCAPSTFSVSVRNRATAVYGQATFNLGQMSPSLDGLKLTAGYRHTWDKIDGTGLNYAPLTAGGFVCSSTGQVVPNDPVGNCTFTGKLRSNAPTWTVGLDYQAARKLLVFAKVSRGYKSGGFNAYSVRPTTRTFAPERVLSYEVGFKSDIEVGTMPVRLNANYYYSNYDNIHKATGDFNAATNASGAQIVAAKARIQGIEILATIKPSSWLEIGGTFSHTDFKYRNFSIVSNGILPDCSGVVQAPGNLSDLRCQKGQYIAPYIYSLYGNASVPLGEDMGTLNLFVSYSHVSSQNTEALVIREQDQPGKVLEPFGLLNASLDWNNVAGSNFDVGLFVTNATNKLYRISNSDVYQTGSLLSQSTIYGEPRMYGLKLKYRFGN